MLAYLVVCRWHSGATYRSVKRPAMLWAASISWSLTFAWIEWDLHNPWTTGDLGLRAISAVLTPLVLGRLLRADDPADRPVGAGGLAVSLLRLSAPAVLVLALYDSVLLYNPAHLPAALGPSALALLVLALLTPRQRRDRGLKPPSVRRFAGGSGGAVVDRAVGAGLVLFAVPSRPCRSGTGPGSGAPGLAAGIGAALAVLVLTDAIRPGEGMVRSSGRIRSG